MDLQSTWIAADRHDVLWAVLWGAAAFGLWAERTRWGGRLSGAVLAIGVTFVLSNVGVIPVQAPAYDVVWSYFVPLAIPLLLMQADVRRIVRESGRTLLAFVAGGAGTVLGTWIAFQAVPLGPEGAKIAGVFCATYVGGSMNYVAAAESLELRSPDLLAAGVAADNLVMTLYFLVLFSLPAFGFVARRFVDRPEVRRRASARLAREGEAVDPPASDDRPRFEPTKVAGAVALASALVVVGNAVASAIGVPSAGILVMTAATVALATAFPRAMARLRVASDAGTLLMMVFFAAIGASANVGIVLRAGTQLFVFAVVILAVHLAVVLAAGMLLKLDLAEVVVASNANTGGPTTAAAMATARRWDGLVTPAVLCGTLGYATATFVGVVVGKFLGA